MLSAQNQDQRARELLTRTLAELRKTGSGQGNHDRAAQLFTDALTAARNAADRFTILVSLYDLALSSQAQGDLAGAAAHLQDGLALAAEAGDETSAALRARIGDAAFDEAKAWAMSTGNRQAVEYALE